jgi:hypothetical protein
LIGGLVFGWHVLHQRSGATTIEEVKRDTAITSTVGRLEATVEVGDKVNLSSVVRAVGVEDARDHDTHVRLGVVSDDGGVDDQSQEGHLVRGRVVLEERSGVVVAYGRVGRALGNGAADSGQNGERFDKHGAVL